MFSRINKDLLPMKAHYFLFNAGTGPVQPFLSVYARQLGFSSVVVGLIYTILPVSGMLAKPLVGAVADRFRCQKFLFLAAQLLTAVSFLAINFCPGIPRDQIVHLSCDDNKIVFDTSTNQNATLDACIIDNLQKTSGIVDCELSCEMNEEYWKVIYNYWNGGQYEGHSTLDFTAHVIRSKILKMNNIGYFPFDNVTLLDGQYQEPRCPPGSENHISTKCNVKCNDYNLNSLLSDSTVPDENVYDKSQFWIFLMCMVFGWVGQAIVVSIGDAICFELLGDKYNKYGYQRMWGALGWGIITVIAGLMVDSLSKGSSTKNLSSAFYLSCSFLFLDFVVSCNLKNAQKKQSVNIIKDVSRLLVDIRIIVFLIWCIAVGMCTALMWNFFFFLIEDLAKAHGCDSNNWIKTLEGLVMAIQTLLGEMPFFFSSGKILKLIGHINAMSLVLLVIGIRYIVYSIIPNPWWFLPVELLNGLTFGLFYACMASYASIVAPPGTEATMQGLVGAVFEGIGVSLGSLSAGVSYDQYGGPWTFRLFGIGALVMFVLHGAVQYLIKRQDFEAQYTSPEQALTKSSLDDDQQELTLVT